MSEDEITAVVVMLAACLILYALCRVIEAYLKWRDRRGRPARIARRRVSRYRY